MMREKLWFDVEIFIVDDSKCMPVKRAVKEISCALIKHVHLSDNMPPLWSDVPMHPIYLSPQKLTLETQNHCPLSGRFIIGESWCN